MTECNGFAIFGWNCLQAIPAAVLDNLLTRFVALMVAVLALFGISGCAEQTALKLIGQSVASATRTLAEKVPIESGELGAEGEITDPEYHVEGLYVTGIVANVRLRGVHAKGTLAGRGRGEAQPSKQQLIDSLDDIIRDKSVSERVADRVLQTQPAK